MDQDFLASILVDGNDVPAFVPYQECTAVEEQGTPIQTPSSSTRPPVKQRSKNFSEAEDKMLVSAWLNISLDAAQGTDQSHSTYWNRIHSYFHEYKNFESDRNPNSLSNRWSDIQKAVNKFASCVGSVDRRKESGLTERDRIVQACTSFQRLTPEKKKFQFLHCWPLLEHQPKWSQLLTSKNQKRSSNSSPATFAPAGTDPVDVEAITQQSDDPLERPSGKKEAKRRRAKRS